MQSHSLRDYFPSLSDTGTTDVLESGEAFTSNLPTPFYTKVKVILDTRLGHNSKQSCLSRFRRSWGLLKASVYKTESGND